MLTVIQSTRLTVKQSVKQKKADGILDKSFDVMYNLVIEGNESFQEAKRKG